MWDLSSFFEQDMGLRCISWGFIGVVFFQILWYLIVFLRVAIHKNEFKGSGSDLPPVSIVICARNEYNNLMNHLPILLKQDYPKFEIVIVNDCSDDETEFLLRNFQLENDNIAVINFRKNYNFFSGKKFPLSLGIRSAKYDTIVLTDADCYPTSEQWLRGMTKPYSSESTELVLGYGGYEKRKTLINKLIRFETLHIAMQYIGLALCGLPYMGVGRNLSYKRGLFYKNNGFIYHYKITSGDDDLFVNEVANSQNTRVVIDKEAMTLSIPKTTFKQWIKQKTRHLSTAKHYKFRDKLLLMLYPMTTLAFYTLFTILMCYKFYYPVVLSVFGFRLALQMLIFWLASRKFNEHKIWLLTPFLEIILLIINTFTLSFTRQRKGRW